MNKLVDDAFPPNSISCADCDEPNTTKLSMIQRTKQFKCRKCGTLNKIGNSLDKMFKSMNELEKTFKNFGK
ncbi:MAG: hypothetical protein GY830_05450 [Bacteroidetes bacterium]|nr:hypothetical protein [Bacteroidota bacterium]